MFIFNFTNDLFYASGFIEELGHQIGVRRFIVIPDSLFCVFPCQKNKKKKKFVSQNGVYNILGVGAGRGVGGVARATGAGVASRTRSRRTMGHGGRVGGAS